MKNIFFISVFFLFSCKTKPSDGDIKNMAMEMLKQEILTPSTAKFPPNDEIKLEREKGDSTFRVSSHVDAQNAFGP